MVKNMLAAGGVEGEIFGEHLQGGVGDLQADGIIRVMVADHDYPNAHEIISEWEASQPATSHEGETKKVVGYGSILLGFILGLLATTMLIKTPITHDGIDYNGDGVLDEQWLYLGELMHSTKLDQNRDGKVDVIWRYDLKGLLKSSSSDNDFDGQHESKCGFRAGNAIWCHVDYDNDGFAEYRESYRFGVVQTVSMFNPRTELLKKKQYFEGGKLKRAEIDLDDDGTLETNYKYDSYEEVQ